MGFLKSFFGAMAANEISERKRIEQEQSKAMNNGMNNADKILATERVFLDYLKQIHCKNVDYDELISDEKIANCSTSSYDVLHAQQVIDRYKKQLKEFINLGGDPTYVHDLNKLNLYIEIVKRLKEYDWLDKQKLYVEFAEDMDLLDMNWEKEEERRKHIPEVLELASNEIKQVLKQDSTEFVPYFDETNDQVLYVEHTFFRTLPLSMSIKLTPHHIFIYSNIYGIDYNKNICCYTHEEIYYKASTKNCSVNVKYMGTFSMPAEESFLVSINDFVVRVKSEEEVKSILDFYKTHNEKISNENILAYENINSLSGIEFERVCKRILENMGFSVETTKTTGDGGIDLIAYNSQPLLSGKYIIQCKRYTGSVGEPAIRDLYGVITSERANKGILMTSGTFTKQAQVFAMEKPIELIDGVKLQELLKKYYC